MLPAFFAKFYVVVCCCDGDMGDGYGHLHLVSRITNYNPHNKPFYLI